MLLDDSHTKQLMDGIGKFRKKKEKHKQLEHAKQSSRKADAIKAEFNIKVKELEEEVAELRARQRGMHVPTYQHYLTISRSLAPSLPRSRSRSPPPASLARAGWWTRATPARSPSCKWPRRCAPNRTT